MLSKKHPKIYKKLKNLQKHNFEKKTLFGKIKIFQKKKKNLEKLLVFFHISQLRIVSKILLKIFINFPVRIRDFKRSSI